MENAFGVLANWFWVFLTTVGVDADKVEKIVNFLLDTQLFQAGLVDQEDDQHRVIPRSWRVNSGLVLQEGGKFLLVFSNCNEKHEKLCQIY